VNGELPVPTYESLRANVFGDENSSRRMRLAGQAVGQPYNAVVNVVNGPLWSRQELPYRTTVLLNFAILGVLNRPHELYGRAVGLLRGGISVQEIQEVNMHIGVYAGNPAGVEANVTLHEATQYLEQEGVAYREEPYGLVADFPTTGTAGSDGLPLPSVENLRANIWGDDNASHRMRRTLSLPSQYGSVVGSIIGPLWAREVLPMRATVLVNYAILGVVNRPHELYTRSVGLLLGGISVAELQEVNMHVGFYRGDPAGAEANATLWEAVQYLEAEGKPFRMTPYVDKPAG
jgi:4-carboxymuconolactone decarboxylase